MNFRVPVTIGYLVIYCPFLAFFLFLSFLNWQWPAFGMLCLFTAITVLLAKKVFKKEKISRIVTAAAAGVFGIAYGILLSRRLIFIIQEGGMERRGGHGSPLAFLLGMSSEIFLLALPALALTLISLFYREEKPCGPIKNHI
jgi:hypothetical protein